MAKNLAAKKNRKGSLVKAARRFFVDMVMYPANVLIFRRAPNEHRVIERAADDEEYAQTRALSDLKKGSLSMASPFLLVRGLIGGNMLFSLVLFSKYLPILIGAFGLSFVAEKYMINRTVTRNEDSFTINKKYAAHVRAKIEKRRKQKQEKTRSILLGHK